MDIGKLGVWTFAFGGAGETEAADALAELEKLGYTAAWFPGFGAWDNARKLLSASRSIVVASGIASIWAYTAEETIEQWRRLRDEFEGRFLLGLGVSHPEAVNAGESKRYSRPVAAMQRFLDTLDAAADGPDAGSRVLAALGPRMLSVAAERARGAHPYFVPVEHTKVARSTLGDGPWLAPEQAVVVEQDPQRARTIARGHMSLYLRLRNYTNNLRRLGYTEEDLADGGSDRLVDAIVAWGDAQAVAARIREHYDAGADHVCIQVLQTDRGLPTDQWRQIAEALA